MHASSGGVTLRRELNLVQSVFIIVGSIIGSGIFVSPSIVLQHSGSFGFSLLLWGVGGIISIAGGLCYCELGTLIQSSGAEYAYVREAFSFRHKKPWMTHLGSLMGFLVLWISVIVVRPATVAINCLTFSQHLLVPFFISCGAAPTAPVILITMATIVAISLISLFNVALTGYVQVVLSAVKVLVCVFIVAVGVWQAVVRDCISQGIRNPWAGTISSAEDIVLALYAVLWAYDGWNALNYSAEEQKNLNKTLPWATIIGVSIVVVCYLLVNVSFFVVLKYQEIMNSEAVALTWANQVLGTTGLVVMPIAIATSTFGASIVILYGGVRQAFVAAKHGHLPQVFCSIHIKHRTPIPAIILGAVLSAAFCAVGDIGSLIDSFSVATWLFYGMAFLSLLILRVTHRHEHRHYKVWLPVPVIMLLVSVLLVTIPLYRRPLQSMVGFVGILSGLPVYYFFVMETPRKLRPKLLDNISGFITIHTNQLLNSVQSTAS